MIISILKIAETSLKVCLQVKFFFNPVSVITTIVIRITHRMGPLPILSIILMTKKRTKEAGKKTFV